MKSTKELARELGLLRKRSISNSLSLRDGKNRPSSNQPFSYLLVLDFESTCWKDGKYKTQEIIEFPCVLLNTQTGQIESEFQFYVQPCENPILSDFCKQLTGITQEQVEQGIPLSLCLKKFEHWISRLHKDKGITFTRGDNQTATGLTAIVTWSDWDLGVCLQYECRRKQITKPAVFNSWIDLRATYRKFYSRKPQGLNGALQDVGIEFEGREHSGLCDARNTARLAWRMIRDGCVMTITKTMKPSSSGRSKMAPSTTETECVFKDSIKTNLSVPVNKISMTTPVIDNKIFESRCTKDIRVYCDGVEPPKAKIARIKSPEKRESGTVVSCGLSEIRHGLRNEVNRVFNNTVSGPPVRNKHTKTNCSITSNKTAANNSVDTASHFSMTSEKKIDSADGISITAYPLSMTNNNTDRLSNNTSNSAVTCNNADGNSGNISGSSITKKNAGRISPGTSALSTTNNNSGKFSLSSKNNTRETPHNICSSYITNSNYDKCSSKSSDVSTASNAGRTYSITGLSTTNVKTFRSTCVSSTSDDNNGRTSYNTRSLSATNNDAGKTSHRMSDSFTTNYHSNKTYITSGLTRVNNNVQNGIPSHIQKPAAATLSPKSCPPVDQPSSCSRTPLQTLKTTNTRTMEHSGLKQSYSTTPLTCYSNVSTTTARGKSNVRSTDTFKTPSPVSGPYLSKSTSTTVTPQNMCNMSGMKSTPPLCKCGRRSKRKMVQSPGPNLGRFFFSCGQGRGFGDGKSGCGFFQWEKESAPRGRQLSRGGLSVGKPYTTPVLNMNKRSWNAVTPVLPKRHLGVRSSQTPKGLR